MIPGRQYSADDIRRIAWRHRELIVLPAAIVAALTVAVSSRLPDRYHAETVILVIPQSVPQDYVRSTVTARMVDRLPTISQQILSRTRLERIINDFDLYAEERLTWPPEEITALMRANIRLEIVNESGSFKVGYESRNPVVATRVTERLAGLFIEENLRDRAVLAEETSAFLESQMISARERLVAQEKKLEAYRLKHGPELPTQMQTNMQAIQNTQAQLQALNDSLNRDRDRRLLAARQLADLQTEEFLSEPGAAGGPVAVATSAAAQLEAALAELAALEERLTPAHPDLLRARRRIADLEKRVVNEAVEGSNPQSPVRPPTATEIAKRNRVRALKAEVESLDRQIETKVTTETNVRRELETYQARVEAVPSRESELASLTRDYETLQDLYRTLLKKLEESRIAENLERRQVGEQFKILDPPRVPQRPFSPNRRLINLGGAAAGLLVGIALVVFFEFKDKSLRAEADVQAALGVPAMAVIPDILTTAERRQRRFRVLGRSAATITVLAACAVVVLLTFRL